MLVASTPVFETQAVMASKQKKRGGKKHKPAPPTGSTGRVWQALRNAASDVIAVLGKGHSERVYHKAMITSLNRKRIAHRSEVIAPIVYMGEVVGFGRCDIVIGNLVVEFKANMRCPKKTSPQLQKYLESLCQSERRRFRGVIINFNQRTGKIDCFQERMAPPHKKQRVSAR